MIDPTAVSTIRVGELPSAPFNLTDNIPHEVGVDLKKGTIEELSTFISAYIGATDAVGFRAISVTDGQTLPTTTKEEFILVGKGTFYNVSGGSTIVCTEELNAIVSNGSFWFIGVEIPVNIELSGVTQFIRQGFTDTTPSEDVVYDALALKVPYTGATSNVNLGEFQLSAGQITFDQTPTQTAGVGVMRWNDTDGTLDLGLKGGNVTLQLGQEQIVRVVNKTGSNLTEAGYQAVYTSGAQGQRLKVDLALANSDLTSAGTLGLITENILVNQEGFVTTNGLVRGINTTGSLQSETWADGDILYLSPITAGKLTNIKPTAPQHSVTIGVCVYAHITQGAIFVKVDNGYELEELHNVLISSVANNQGLFYESATSLWKNKSIGTVLGYTPANDSLVVHLSGDEIINDKKSFSYIAQTIQPEYSVNTPTVLPITLEQGYTFDGTYHYLFGTSRLTKYDSSWAIVIDNTTPFTGISGVNHLGDGVELGGFIYAPVETYPAVTGMKIAKYNSSTLALVTTYDISAQGHECSSIATDGTTLYISSYNDGTKIWKYSLTGTYLGFITISEPFTNNIQGISYYNSEFYITEQTRLSKLSLDGSKKTFIGYLAGNTSNSHRGEGLQVVSGNIRVLILNDTETNLYTYTLTGQNISEFKADNSGFITGRKLNINGEAFFDHPDVTDYANIPLSALVIGARAGGLVPMIASRSSSTAYTSLFLLGLQDTDVARVTESDILFRTSFGDSSSNITTSGSAFGFYNGSTSLLDINRNGKVGIGMTTAPFSNILNTNGGIYNQQTSGAGLTLRTLSNGSTASPIENSILWKSNSPSDVASINVPDSRTNVTGVPMIFSTRNNSNVYAERFRITNLGQFNIANLIGTGTRIVVSDSSGNLSTILRDVIVQPDPTSKTATATLTIAEILTNIITVNSASAVSLTLPTGTLTDAGAYSGTLAVNDSFQWNIINIGNTSGAVTMVAGTGHTIVGSTAIAIGTSATFKTRKTATNTFITYRIN